MNKPQVGQIVYSPGRDNKINSHEVVKVGDKYFYIVAHGRQKPYLISNWTAKEQGSGIFVSNQLYDNRQAIEDRVEKWRLMNTIAKQSQHHLREYSLDKLRKIKEAMEND
jgi:hypothetical protein